MTQSVTRPFGFWENTGIGALAGVLEVAVNQPLVTLKNELQRGEKSSLSGWRTKKVKELAKVLYGGFGANATGMSLVTAIQLGSYNSFLKLLQKGQKETEEQKFFAAAAAGGVAAGAASPSELLMLRYNMALKAGLKTTYKEVFENMVKHEGWKVLTKGLFHTAVRDSGFTVGYVAAAPYLKEKLQPILGETKATLASGVVAGVVAAVLTHPFDTWKTNGQEGLNTPVWQGTVKKTCLAAFKGLSARSTRVVLAIPLLSETKSQLTQFYQRRMEE